MWCYLLLFLLLGACADTTAPKPLPPCKRIPLLSTTGDTIGYTYRIDYFGVVPTCQIPK